MGAGAVAALVWCVGFLAAVIVPYRMHVTGRRIAFLASAAAVAGVFGLHLLGRPENIPFLRVLFFGALVLGTVSLLVARRYLVATFFALPLAAILIERQFGSSVAGLIREISGMIINLIVPLAAVFFVGAFLERRVKNEGMR